MARLFFDKYIPIPFFLENCLDKPKSQYRGDVNTFVLVIGPLSTGSVLVGGGFIRKETKT